MTRPDTLIIIRKAVEAANPHDPRGMSESEQVWNDAVRSVSLANVLLSIQKRQENKNTFDFYLIADSGMFLSCHGNDKFDIVSGADRKILIWNLRESLDQQSDECLAFLSSLLK